MPNMDISTRGRMPVTGMSLPAGATTQVMAAGQAGGNAENARFDRQQSMASAADQKRIDGYKAILADPQNAEAVAKMHGIPMTQSLQVMLQQPLMLKNIIMAQEFATKMGIKNPVAIEKIMLEAGNQGKNGQPFNPTQVLGAADGMDTQEPMNAYQRGSLGIQQQNADTNAGYKDTMADYYSKQGDTNAARYTKPWENPSLPIDLQMAGAGLAKQFESGMGDEQALAAWKAKADPYLNPQGGAQPQPGGGTGAAPAMPAAATPAIPGMPTRPVAAQPGAGMGWKTGTPPQPQLPQTYDQLWRD